MQPVQVRMDHNKLLRAFIGCCRILLRSAQPQRTRDYRREQGTRARILACEQGHLVSLLDQLLGQPMHDPLRPAVEFGRNAFSERRDLGYCVKPRFFARRLELANWRPAHKPARPPTRRSASCARDLSQTGDHPLNRLSSRASKQGRPPSQTLGSTSWRTLRADARWLLLLLPKRTKRKANEGCDR